MSAVEPTGENLREHLWKTWLDLLTLETNTIIKEEGMTARKMEPLPVALLDIADAYARFIETKTDHDLRGWWHGPGADRSRRQTVGPSRLSPGQARNPVATTTASDTFDRLRHAAAHILRALEARRQADRHEAGDTARTALVLYRIHRSAGSLFDIAKELEAEPQKWKPFRDLARDQAEKACRRHDVPVLPPDQTRLLRKIREVGTEIVVLQTVIQLDGDVVTRIEPGLIRDNDCELIFKIHGDSVRHSVQYWQFLVQTLQQFLVTAAAPAPAGWWRKSR